jgi:ATP-dependent exoDNAse (exonuclease V) beta subunit
MNQKKGNAKQLSKRINPDYEELRTAYVAMTRPRRLLVVAVPKGNDHKLLWRFGATAFRTPGAAPLPDQTK